MRIADFFLALSLFFIPGALLAFEIEEQRRFGPEDATALQIISTTDIEILSPLIEAFLDQHPGTAIDYVTVSSSELMKAVAIENQPFDVALSSAMDLQIKLANDGFTQSNTSPATALVPDWGNWLNHVFAFSQEPASIVISPAAFAGLQAPRTRQALISLLRQNPDRFRGRIATYDIEASGLGYLFATQDARTSESYWRLMEVLGSLNVKLFCCSGEMIEHVSRGHIAVAYNVLGSYARARQAQGARIEIIEPEDYTNLMLRTAVILKTSSQVGLAREFVDHLLRAAWSDPPDPDYPFERLLTGNDLNNSFLRPISLGPGLLAYLDRLKQKRFRAEWRNAVRSE